MILFKHTLMVLTLFLTITAAKADPTASAKPVEDSFLVISDIDDTLKLSHMLSLFDVGLYALRTDSYYLGVNDALRALSSENPSAQIYYLSNAVNWMMGNAHKSFLSRNKFPSGKLLLRSSLSVDNFKIESIKRLIRQHNPKRVILIGDNGEHDTEVYAEAVRLFPDIEFRTWIHTVYYSAARSKAGKKLEVGQAPWATAMDLLIDWVKLGLVKVPTVEAVGQSLVPAMLKQSLSQDTGAVAFPSWLDCRDLTKANAIRASSFSWGMAYAQLVQRRCRH